MKKDQVSKEISLHQGSPIHLIDAQGTRVCSLAGIVWISTAGAVEDIFLQTGESCLISRNGLTLVESIGDGRVRLEKARKLDQPGKWLAPVFSR